MNKTFVRRTSQFFVASAVFALIVVASLFAASRFRTPSPLTPQETRDVTTAINAIAPGAQITNLRRDTDGNVRAFLPGNPEGGRIVVVSNENGNWRAVVETLCF